MVVIPDRLVKARSANVSSKRVTLVAKNATWVLEHGLVE